MKDRKIGSAIATVIVDIDTIERKKVVTVHTHDHAHGHVRGHVRGHSLDLAHLLAILRDPDGETCTSVDPTGSVGGALNLHPGRDPGPHLGLDIDVRVDTAVAPPNIVHVVATADLHLPKSPLPKMMKNLLLNMPVTKRSESLASRQPSRIRSQK